MSPKEHPKILIVGSVNMDLVVRTPRLPCPGETLTGSSFLQIPGGKGANQAVAAARLGARVKMIGRVGDDSFGKLLFAGLQADDVSTSGIQKTKNCSTGVAIIGVEDSGQNCITVIPGANGELTSEDIKIHSSLFDDTDVLLLQLEIPLPTVQTAVQLASERDVSVILDPAPAVAELPPDLWHVDVVCPNESEAETLTGISVDSVTSAQQAAVRMLDMGAQNAIVTLGDSGCVVASRAGLTEHIQGFEVTALDTTAAGDAFAAALGVILAEQSSVVEAARFACAAGALATTVMGAQPGMPDRAGVDSLLTDIN